MSRRALYRARRGPRATSHSRAGSIAAASTSIEQRVHDLGRQRLERRHDPGELVGQPLGEHPSARATGPGPRRAGRARRRPRRPAPRRAPRRPACVTAVTVRWAVRGSDRAVRLGHRRLRLEQEAAPADLVDEQERVDLLGRGQRRRPWRARRAGRSGRRRPAARGSAPTAVDEAVGRRAASARRARASPSVPSTCRTAHAAAIDPAPREPSIGRVDHGVARARRSSRSTARGAARARGRAPPRRPWARSRTCAGPPRST